MDKILLVDPKGRRYLVSKDKKQFSTNLGTINLTKIKKPGKYKTHIGREFIALKPSFSDLVEFCKRGPQAIILKDASYIISKTSIDKTSKIVDAGTGSGWLAAQLAHIAKNVTTYERRKEFIKIAERNFKLLELKNIKIKEKDIYKGISEKNLDLITLDLSEPWKIQNISKALKPGAWIAAYLPQTTQVQRFIQFIEKQPDLILDEITELIKRDWQVSEKVNRPKSQMIAHTAFLVFVRKL
jgi:tRNA (adenine57-N1/adenine58-N1)-methyltransferase